MATTKMPTLTSRFSSKGPTTTSGSAIQSPPGAPAQAGDGVPKVLRDFREKIRKGVVDTIDTSTMSAIIDAMRHTDGIDDRKLLLEHGLAILAKLPEGDLQNKLQHKIVTMLYNDLAHPPATYIGSQFQFRSADGSGNNVTVPDMGKAGTPYARSVQQTHPLPRSAMPDAGLVFDTLLKREGFIKHPAGLSSMMFSFAALVIHSVFRTSHADPSINETSSYVDLSPLYGHNQEAQDKVRVRDGYGLLHADSFAEDRLLLLPPAVCVLLVLFSRNHNVIANKLLEINERGTWIDPAKLADDPDKTVKLVKQEEEIFQTARLINATWFASVVFSDYLSSILGTVRQGTSWSLSPNAFADFRTAEHTLVERGMGNVCSVEFNCLYRWHATTSVQDERWIHKAFGKIFGDSQDPGSLTVTDFKKAARKLQMQDPDPTHWTFGEMRRDTDGTFNDEDLAKILHDATDSPAAAFRARGTPAAMRLHEIMGIEANRGWGVCSLNDFRQYLGLKTYMSFEEWNPDPAIYEAAEKLYGHIDNLELYVGLQAEEVKPVVEGAGLCPGYTISRAILSDAIALTRGDRFFTADATPYNMTAWGFNDCQRNPAGPGNGSTLGRLFLRTLPDNFTSNSIYTWFPLQTPESMEGYLKDLDLVGKYDFARPLDLTPIRVVKEHAQVVQILNNPGVFGMQYAPRAAEVIKGDGFYLAEPEVARGEREQMEIISALDAEAVKASFARYTSELIEEWSFALVGGAIINVDIVRNVLKHVPLYWAAGELAGIDIKSKRNPRGSYTAETLFDVLGDIYAYMFLECDQSKVMVLREKVTTNIKTLLAQIKGHLGTGLQRISVAGFVDTISHMFSKNKASGQHEISRRLHGLGHSTDQLANSVLAILVGATVEMSLALTNMVNCLFENDELKALDLTDGAAGGALAGFVRESMRIDAPFRGVYREALVDQVVGGVAVKKGERLFVDVAEANINADVYPDPAKFSATRNRSKEQILYADGVFRCLGEELANGVMSEVLRVIFTLPNVRRGPGQSGRLARFKDRSNPMLSYGYLDHRDQSDGPWPTSMVIQYDAISAPRVDGLP